MTERSYGPLIATLIVIAVNAAANLVPLGGMNTGQLSALYPTGFTPPGWVFGIWPIIYLGLLAFSLAAIFGVPATRERIAAIRTPYYVSAFGNAAWIFVWHYRMVALSVAVMLLLLAALIVIFLRLRRLPEPARTAWITVDAPFSLYFGWITTATLVNFATLCFEWKWYPFGLTMDQWALATVVAAGALYAWMGALTRDVVYCAVFVWAAFGVWTGTPVITPAVQLAAGAGAAVVIVSILWNLVSRAYRATTPAP